MEISDEQLTELKRLAENLPPTEVYAKSAMNDHWSIYLKLRKTFPALIDEVERLRAQTEQDKGVVLHLRKCLLREEAVVIWGGECLDNHFEGGTCTETQKRCPINTGLCDRWLEHEPGETEERLKEMEEGIKGFNLDIAEFEKEAKKELIAEVRRLYEERRWIPVKEHPWHKSDSLRWEDYEGEWLVLSESRGKVVASPFADEGRKGWLVQNKWLLTDIIYYMSLPAPPREEAEDG